MDVVDVDGWVAGRGAGVLCSGVVEALCVAACVGLGTDPCAVLKGVVFFVPGSAVEVRRGPNFGEVEGRSADGAALSVGLGVSPVAEAVAVLATHWSQGVLW